MALDISANGERLQITTVPTTGALTVLGLWRVSASPSTYAGPVSMHASGAEMLIAKNTGTGGSPSYYTEFNGGGSAATIGAAISASTWYGVSYSRASASDHTIRVFDANFRQDTSRTSTSTITANGTLRFGDSLTYSNEDTHRSANWKVYTAELTQAEIEQELRVFHPQRTANLWAWYPMIGATVAQLQQDWSGNGRNLSEVGTTGVADGPALPWAIRAPAAGTPAAGGTDTNITPPQGTLTLSATAPIDPLLDHARSGASAALTLSPTAPTAAVNHLRTPTTAQFTLSSVAPDRVVASLRNPAAGDLTLSGVAPTDPLLDHARVPTTAQLVLSTTAPSLGTSVNITPPQGDLTLSTSAPIDPLLDHARSGAAGDLTLSTTAPSRVRTETPDPPAGDLTLSTTAPIDPLLDHTRTGDAAQLVLSTTAPAVSHPIGISPPAGDLTLSTVAPSVGGNVERNPPQGTLTLSTTAPTATQDHLRSGAAGALVLSATAPTVSHPIAISPGAGTLTLSSVAPQVTSTQLVATGDTTWSVGFHPRTWTPSFHSRTWNVIR